ncbi:hypothetical protein TRFO_21563 [Tritrichomonas foetus]|uniref:Uncharacterized protein n=1 Tax=Tritrichomonas foetus TaxID=1144522 RepID=A0A1J4KJH5_9EUKA|nr:hypothetical protein TRFO_21563 [Tritrichomonas foetus]|eukprot:OHT09517.1 hypothetical protein TRFO_21563 [Tritrichomonas foetus]
MRTRRCKHNDTDDDNNDFDDENFFTLMFGNDGHSILDSHDDNYTVLTKKVSAIKKSYKKQISQYEEDIQNFREIYNIFNIHMPHNISRDTEALKEELISENDKKNIIPKFSTITKLKKKPPQKSFKSPLELRKMLYKPVNAFSIYEELKNQNKKPSEYQNPDPSQFHSFANKGLYVPPFYDINIEDLLLSAIIKIDKKDNNITFTPPIENSDISQDEETPYQTLDLNQRFLCELESLNISPPANENVIITNMMCASQKIDVEKVEKVIDDANNARKLLQAILMKNAKKIAMHNERCGLIQYIDQEVGHQISST